MKSGKLTAPVVVKWLLWGVFAAYFALALFLRAHYRWDDSPAFRPVSAAELAAGAVFAGAAWLCARRERPLSLPSEKAAAALYLCAAAAFILLLPLKPFSDMGEIWRLSLAAVEGNWADFRASPYLAAYPNNLFVCLVYAFFLKLLPDGIWVPKLLNALAFLLMARSSAAIAEKLTGRPCGRGVFFFVLFCPGAFLYLNHVYTDVFFTLLSLWAVQLCLCREKGLFWATLLLLPAYLLRPVAAIYLIALWMARLLELGARRERLKGVLLSAAVFAGGLFLWNAGTGKLLTADGESTPAASYLYMGLNEEEFGFQDGSHSPDRRFSDVLDRLRSYTPGQVGKLLAKKSFWIWTEGTWQAERYAFGEAAAEPEEKYEYETPLTRHFMNPEQKAYALVDALCRGAYMALAFLALRGSRQVIRDGRWNLFALLFLGFFLFYLMWEIKSRYLFSLYPLMVVYAAVRRIPGTAESMK